MVLSKNQIYGLVTAIIIIVLTKLDLIPFIKGYQFYVIHSSALLFGLYILYKSKGWVKLLGLLLLLVGTLFLVKVIAIQPIYNVIIYIPLILGYWATTKNR